MANVEDVIKAWNCCNPFNRKCKECPYEKDCYHDGISRHMVADAVAMLKSQQAEIERLKSNKPDCEHAEHDGCGCLGYSGSHDDEPIEECKNCEKYTGNN